MSLYLYGLIRHDQTIDFGPIGFENGVVRAVCCGDFSGIIGLSPREDFRQIPKEEIIRLLLAHQKTLETIMARYFVLPFKFGTTVKDENELLKIVREGEDFLSDLFGKVKDSVEIDVVATWDVRTILQEISEQDPAVIACKEEMAHGRADRVHIGMLLAQALKQRATEWHRHITGGLRNCATASAEHDLLNDEMILNSSFLIEKRGGEKFYHAVDELDLHFKEKLHFKCVGPLPPYSFATITLKRFDPGEVQCAAEVLGLNGTAELTIVKKVYKELSRQCHPDTDPNLSAGEFEKLNRAYEILVDYCEDGPKPLAKAAVEKSVRLKIMENPHAT